MDLRSFLTTFGLVFLAELGDKTQLATMGMAATGGQKWLVFAAASIRCWSRAAPPACSCCSAA